MPLDVAGLCLTRLEAVAHELELYPIPKQVLENHKEREITKHPPHFLYRYKDMLPKITMTVILFSGFFAIGLAMVHLKISALYAVCIFVASLASLVAADEIKIRGPAEWREISLFNISERADIPLEFREMALEFSLRMPVAFVIGELIQDKVVLDPYLMAYDYRNDQILVLGIWVGDKILASAKVA